MKRFFLSLLCLFLFSACLMNAVVTQQVSDTPGESRRCGDGVCAAPENSANCASDCGNPASTAASQATKEPGGDTSAPGDAPFFITTMTHLEGSMKDDENQDAFLIHVEQMRAATDMAAEYGAILTFESEKPFARANSKWNLNILAEVRDRGFGVGTHCDFGFKEPVMSVEKYADLFRENKTLVDNLVGAENNLGCSGGGSRNDWALAASMAGFKYIDGVVTMHYLSMPIENRPGPEWTDAFIMDGNHHFNAPVDLMQRIYPFGIANALDFVADPNPVIVVSSGEMGALANIAEGTNELESLGKTAPKSKMENSDVDALVAKIRAVDATRDRNRVAKMTVYIALADFTPENETVLRYFYSKMKELVQAGILIWATQKQVYETYEARFS